MTGVGSMYASGTWAGVSEAALSVAEVILFPNRRGKEGLGGGGCRCRGRIVAGFRSHRVCFGMVFPTLRKESGKWRRKHPLVVYIVSGSVPIAQPDDVIDWSCAGVC